MNLEEARRVLARSRELRWRFPSSAGNPLRPGEQPCEGAPPERDEVARASRVLMESAERAAATELAANVWRLWMLQPRDVAAGHELLAHVLAGDGDSTRAGSFASYGCSLFAYRLGEHEESRRRSEQALEAAQACGDAEALALAYLGLSRAALEQGGWRRARSLAVEAREHARAVRDELGQAPLHLHAQALRAGGRLDEAAALFEESLALNRRIGDPSMVAVELTNLGHVEVRRGNVEAAAGYFGELGPDRWELNDAALAFARGEREQARALLGRVDGDELPLDDRAEAEWLSAWLAEV